MIIDKPLRTVISTIQMSCSLHAFRRNSCSQRSCGADQGFLGRSAFSGVSAERRRRTHRLWFALILIALLFPADSFADNAALSQRQAGVTERYQKLEELLLRLADMEVVENPERAALLRRAARQSRDKFVLEKLRSATDSLRTEEFQKAVESQESANEELAALLTLLMSEDRSKRIRD